MGADRSDGDLAARARSASDAPRLLPDVGILTTMPEIDPVPPDSRFLRERIVQTGPAIGRASETTAGPDAPILVSLSTISYPGQQNVLQRLVDAVGRLGIPAIVTTGPSLDPADIVAAANVDVRRFVPHEQLLPTVRLVVGHGGHGTTMRALAHGVPVLVVPMSSVADHAMVADAIVAAGAGGRVSKRASADELARAIAQILDDDGVRENAARLGATLRGRDAAAAAADLIEATIRGDRAPRILTPWQPDSTPSSRTRALRRARWRSSCATASSGSRSPGTGCGRRGCSSMTRRCRRTPGCGRPSSVV